MCVFFGPVAGLADAAGPVARRSREGKRLKGPPGQTRGGGRGRGQWWKRNRGKRGGDVGGKQESLPHCGAGIGERTLKFLPAALFAPQLTSFKELKSKWRRSKIKNIG